MNELVDGVLTECASLDQEPFGITFPGSVGYSIVILRDVTSIRQPHDNC